MKNIDQIFNYIVLPVDLVMIFASFLLAYWIRANALPFSVIYIWPFDRYIIFALEMLPVWILAFAISGTYSKRRPAFLEIPQIIAASSLGSMAVVLWVFIFRSDFFSRLIVFYIWILAIILIFIGRFILSFIHQLAISYGSSKKRTLIIGTDSPTTQHIRRELERKKGNQYRLVGIIGPHAPTLNHVKYLGQPADLDKIIKEQKIDDVLLADPSYNNESVFDFLLTCQENNATFRAVPAHAQVGARTLEFDAFAGIPIIEYRGTALDGWGAVIKRILDIIGSAVALVVLIPFILIIAILIRIDSRGSVIYRNIRVGKNKDFITYKFRTMFIENCTGAEYGGKDAYKLERQLIDKQDIKKGSAVYKIADDPRVTKIGRFLRNTSLDELPQLYNVLIGNMSLVGPRPHQPREVAKYTREQRKTLLIKPGITGLAQISGRSDLTFDEEARLDINYIENWSLWLDLYIILKTPQAVIKGKGTY